MKPRVRLVFLLCLGAASCDREIEIGPLAAPLDSQSSTEQVSTNESDPESTGTDTDPSTERRTGCTPDLLETPLPQMANARAVWAASHDDVVVTGLFGAVHFDGTKWSAHQPELPGATTIWGKKRDDLWLGWPRCRGAGQLGCRPVDPLLLRASDTGTKNVDFGVRSWNDVWVSSLGDAVAVGDNGRAAIMTDGAWRSIDTGTTKDLYAVWGSSISSVFASGGFFRTVRKGLFTEIEGAITYWDGGRWSELSCCGDDGGRARLFVDIHGSFFNDVYSLSNHFICSSDTLPLCEPRASIISHWDGMKWEDDTEPFPQKNLSALWSSSSDDVYAAGGVTSFDNDRANWSEQGVLYHRDALTGWSLLPLSLPPLFAVGGSGPEDMIIAGNMLTGPLLNPTETLWTSRFTSGEWTTIEQEASSSTRGDIWYRSPEEIYMSGPGLRRLGDGRWNDVAVPGLSNFSAVSGNDSGVGVAVTRSGQIAEYRNGQWKAVDPGAICDGDEGISGIWGHSSSDVYVVCKSRHIFHFDGFAWDQLYPNPKGWPPTAPIWSLIELVSVRGFDDGTIFFGGSMNSPSSPGVVVTWHEERGWTAQALVAQGPIRDIWGRSADDAYAAGRNSLLHYDGTAWKEISCTEGSSACENMRPRAISGDDEGIYIASGDCDPLCTANCQNATPGSGMLLRYDGAGLEILAQADCFFDVTTTPSGRVFATASNLIDGVESAQVLSYTCLQDPE